MRRLDDFLIDRVFQPVADWLSPWVSPYALGAFLLTGGCLAIICMSAYLHWWASLTIAMLWMPFALRRAYRQEHAPPSNLMPLTRLVDMPIRLFLLFLQLFCLPLVMFADTPIMINQGGWWLVVIADYFFACRKNPPPPRASRVPAFSARATGDASA